MYPGLLAQGSTGAFVTALQAALNLYPQVSPKLQTDGVFGSRTLAAVRQWQQAYGFSVTGTVDPTMLQALGIGEDASVQGGTPAGGASSSGTTSAGGSQVPHPSPQPQGMNTGTLLLVGGGLLLLVALMSD